MPDQIPEEIKTARSHILQDLNAKNMADYEASFKGKKVEVLFEEPVWIDGKEYYTGHTKEYLTVTKAAEGRDLSNEILDCIF